MRQIIIGLFLALGAAFLLTNIPNKAIATPDNDYLQAVNNKNRPAADLPRDAGRLPLALLKFMQLKPGMVVFEQGAGGGYTTELLARAVGASGKVFAEGLSPSRIANNRLPQVSALERGLIYQIPERAAKAGLKNGQVDAVVMMFTYHDLALNDRIDRQSMLKDMLTMLKPGGTIIVADNAAVKGSGLKYNPQLHRIDPELVRHEFEQAGFVFDANSDLYHNPKDNLKAHWRFLSKPRRHERLLMRFKKPQ